jgi:hypothetical protein
MLLTTMVMTDELPEPGDLVAFHFEDPESYLIDVYDGPTGRGHSGQFVKKGSPQECHAIGPLRYLPGKDGVTILGKVSHRCYPA